MGCLSVVAEAQWSARRALPECDLWRARMGWRVGLSLRQIVGPYAFACRRTFVSKGRIVNLSYSGLGIGGRLDLTSPSEKLVCMSFTFGKFSSTVRVKCEKLSRSLATTCSSNMPLPLM